MGRVVSIVYTPRDTPERKPQDRYARVPLDRATLVERRGIRGDAKGGTGDRQLNVMVADVLEELDREGFKTGPGELGEQIVIAGIPAAALTPGVQLRLGESVVEVTIPRTGCARFEMIQGHPKQAVQGRLGVMAKVVAGGEVGVGDAAEVVAAP